jgi:hypothetical protein
MTYCGWWQADLGSVYLVVEVTVWTANFGGIPHARLLELSETGAFEGESNLAIVAN